ncbi:hypothetical protein PQR46_08110 [Paraburkholderia sediminicola]|uniref:hypothetical protein n=1 Tax=Paraburkholderia TaxID=1822464 RepID=UPI0038BBDCFC
MSTAFIAIVAIALVCISSLVAYRAGQRRTSGKDLPASTGVSSGAHIQSQFKDDVHDVKLVDTTGAVVFEGAEIPNIPYDAHRMDTSSSEISQLSHLATDLLKGGLSTPGKTIRLVFKPEIHKGLKDGTYTLMQTKSGEVLADAVDSSHQIVGKGRIVQGGQARQLAAGAFQLVGIAVAQAHLADIESSLGSIKSALSELLDRLENTDRSNISGAIAYLSEVAQHMKHPQGILEFSSEKSQTVEAIIRDGYAWRDKVKEDLVGLTNQIVRLADKDKFGTANSHKELRSLVEKVKPLLIRHELLLQLTALTTMIVAYLDPAGRKFTKVKPGVDEWMHLVAKFREASVEKATNLLSEARFTNDELLSYRRMEIYRLAEERESDAQRQTSSFDALMRKLDKNVRHLTQGDGTVSLALTYDDRGTVKDAALL